MQVELGSGEEEAQRYRSVKQEVPVASELGELDTDGAAGVTAKRVDYEAGWTLPD
jgi:hypothetical protein